MSPTASADSPAQLSTETLAKFLEECLACPKCHGAMLSKPAGYVCRSCGVQFQVPESYVDFLDPTEPSLSSTQTDFSDHYVVQHTPYWAALRQTTEAYSASLPSIFSTLLGRPARCLDIGLSLVSAGHFRPHLERYAGLLAVYCGLDPDAQQLEGAEDGLFMARSVGEALPFVDEAFDLVLIHATLDHCFDYQKTLDECARVLVPDGVTSIILNNDHSWAKQLLPWVARGRRRSASAHHNVFLGPRAVIKEMEKRGFEITRLRGSRYLLLPPAGLETLARLCGASTPRLLALLDAVGNRLAPTLGGDFHLIFRKPGPNENRLDLS
jgi:SAM-dependent methyltransferase